MLTVRVPNERDNKGTVKVDLRLPDGFYFLSYKKVRGWKTTLTRETLDDPGRPRRVLRRRAVHPHRLEGQSRGRAASSGPTSSRSSRSPSASPTATQGDQLVFPAFQTYRGGERVAWTGAPDADEPAPRVTLTAPVAEG